MSRFKQIDVLRAVAVFAVLGRHMVPCPAGVSALAHDVTTVWARGGWMGVDLFFVLSGFLVSGLLFREHEKHGELRIGHFLVRRGFKIYPPFWIVIAATVAFWLLRYGRVPMGGLGAELLFVQNYLPPLWNHTWSLAVEEHFYLLLAVAFYFLARWRPRRPFGPVPVMFLVVAVVCLALRIFVSLDAPYSNERNLFPTHLRLDSLFFGVLLSYWYHLRPDRFLDFARQWRWPLAVLGMIPLVLPYLFEVETTPFLYTWGLTLLYLGSGAILVAALGFRSPTSAPARAVEFMGSHSYSVYLWHMPVAAWGAAVLERIFPNYNWFLYAAMYLLGSIVFGVVMASIIESPVLRLRDRLFPSRGNAMSAG